jgi:hypothetical protein
MPALSHALSLDSANHIFRRTNRSTKNGKEGAAAQQSHPHRRTSPNTTTLSPNDINRAAALLVQKFGESAIAGAMLHAHEAEIRGAFVEMANWRRIAESALHRFDA